MSGPGRWPRVIDRKPATNRSRCLNTATPDCQRPCSPTCPNAMRLGHPSSLVVLAPPSARALPVECQQESPHTRPARIRLVPVPCSLFPASSTPTVNANPKIHPEITPSPPQPVPIHPLPQKKCLILCNHAAIVWQISCSRFELFDRLAGVEMRKMQPPERTFASKSHPSRPTFTGSTQPPKPTFRPRRAPP